MIEEAEEIIRKDFDNKDGAQRLFILIEKTKGMTEVRNLLSMTNYDKKIKLKQMERTWAFTRPSSMVFKLIETFFYVIISNTQSLIYIAMIFSMFMNAGLISLIYPLSVFGYAMLEETRPRK
jgi:hypothetical protein